METPYLDKEIEWMSGDPQKHIEQLKEYKAIKEALSIHSVIPSKIPDKLYLEIEERKCERYGGVLHQIDKQAEYSHGQCDTIEAIEGWLKTL